jgi:hypothetical protein
MWGVGGSRFPRRLVYVSRLKSKFRSSESDLFPEFARIAIALTGKHDLEALFGL